MQSDLDGILPCLKKYSRTYWQAAGKKGYRRNAVVLTYYQLGGWPLICKTKTIEEFDIDCSKLSSLQRNLVSFFLQMSFEQF